MITMASLLPSEFTPDLTRPRLLGPSTFGTALPLSGVHRRESAVPTVGREDTRKGLDIRQRECRIGRFFLTANTTREWRAFWVVGQQEESKLELEVLMRNLKVTLIMAAALLLPSLALAQEGDWLAWSFLTGAALIIVFIIAAVVDFGVWVTGLILTIIDTAKRRQNAQGFLIAFICTFLAGFLFAFLGVVWFIVPLANIVLLITYLSVRGKSASVSAAGPVVGYTCPRCGRPQQPGWSRCPYCAQADVPRAPVQPVTAPVGPGIAPVAGPAAPSPIRVSPSGQKTIIIGKQEYPVYALLVVREGVGVGREFPVYQERTAIGRDATQCQVPVDDDSASRQHAAIVYRDGNFVIQDLASRNGTYINAKGFDDAPLAAPHVLKDGDIIGIGRTRLIFKRIW